MVMQDRFMPRRWIFRPTAVVGRNNQPDDPARPKSTCPQARTPIHQPTMIVMAFVAVSLTKSITIMAWGATRPR
jgi:hypothetical protein